MYGEKRTRAQTKPKHGKWSYCRLLQKKVMLDLQGPTTVLVISEAGLLFDIWNYKGGSGLLCRLLNTSQGSRI